MGVLFKDPKQYHLPANIRLQVKGLTNELYIVRRTKNKPKGTFHFEGSFLRYA